MIIFMLFSGTELFRSVRLMADPKYVRAWEGGIGAFKAGGLVVLLL